MTEQSTGQLATPAGWGSWHRSRRRSYFRKLHRILVASGVDPGRVRTMVADQDRWVVRSGNDPFQELGPVGALAGSMRPPVKAGRVVSQLVLVAALAVSLGLLIGSTWAVVRGDGPVRTLRLGGAVYLLIVMVGEELRWGFGSGGLQGGTNWERPGWPAAVLRVLSAMLVALVLLSDRFKRLVGLRSAWELLALSAVVAVVLGLARWRQLRVTVLASGAAPDPGGVG